MRKLMKLKVRQLKKDKGVKGDNDIVKSLEKYKNEYLRTKRTYDNLDDLKKDKIGYGDLWQVRYMGKDEVLQKIDEIYENLLRGQKENGEGKCFTLDTEQANVYVEELQCKVLKGKSTYPLCQYQTISQPDNENRPDPHFPSSIYLKPSHNLNSQYISQLGTPNSLSS
ncbi:hypothetical protein ACLB2K_060989 [Fragaria x ananassa]